MSLMTRRTFLPVLVALPLHLAAAVWAGTALAARLTVELWDVLGAPRCLGLARLGPGREFTA